MEPQNRVILIVEDDAGANKALSEFLELSQFKTICTHSIGQAVEVLNGSTKVNLLLCDLRLGAEDGLDLLRHIRSAKLQVPFILMTAFGEVTSAVDAMKLGAHNYLLKPINPDELLVHIERAIDTVRKDEMIENLSERLDSKTGLGNMVGNSKVMQDLFARVRRAARSDSTVLIVGESGTGKELLAEAIHQHSARKDGPYVAVNMAAVPETLVESELFGHVKGSFTGATATRTGRFQSAQDGTLFIDEIGDFVLESQAKLLRVLEARTITPVGSNQEQEVNARVVAATSRNLEEMVAAGRFRDDLYYRLGVLTLWAPPLRDRAEDIPLLVRHFLDQLAQSNGRPSIGVSHDLARFLETFSWPGNVRQLRNCLESMVIMSDNAELTMEDLPASLNPKRTRTVNPVNLPMDMTLDDLERVAIRQALDRFQGNRTHAARALGISVRTLQRKLLAWSTNTPMVDSEEIESSLQ